MQRSRRTISTDGGASPRLDQYLAFGDEVMTRAGVVAAAEFRRPTAVADKSGGGEFDPVTTADQRVEAAIREQIAARYPAHGVHGEELADRRGAGAWQWVVDPIDGTRSFVAGLPTWGCLLGLLRDGEPVLGWMRQPLIGETFSGNGEHAWVQGDGARTTIGVRTDATLADAVLAATHPAMFTPDAWDRFEGLAARVRMTRFGGECYNYCLLAHGLIDIVVEDDLQAHDILPLVPIVRGAGGVITDVTGATPRGGLVVAAANPRLHAEALRAMRR